jgi:hypothetical protein
VGEKKCVNMMLQRSLANPKDPETSHSFLLVNSCESFNIKVLSHKVYALEADQGQVHCNRNENGGSRGMTFQSTEKSQTLV